MIACLTFYLFILSFQFVTSYLTRNVCGMWCPLAHRTCRPPSRYAICNHETFPLSCNTKTSCWRVRVPFRNPGITSNLLSGTDNRVFINRDVKTFTTVIKFQCIVLNMSNRDLWKSENITERCKGRSNLPQIIRSSSRQPHTAKHKWLTHRTRWV